MLRFFRSTDEVYEGVRAALDAAWGYANAETKTATSLTPAVDAPRDSQGRAYLVIAAVYCGYEATAEMLPQLLASGAVEEISEAEYGAVANPPLPARL
jgi:hypothetical protein